MFCFNTITLIWLISPHIWQPDPFNNFYAISDRVDNIEVLVLVYNVHDISAYLFMDVGHQSLVIFSVFVIDRIIKRLLLSNVKWSLSNSKDNFYGFSSVR